NLAFSREARAVPSPAPGTPVAAPPMPVPTPVSPAVAPGPTRPASTAAAVPLPTAAPVTSTAPNPPSASPHPVSRASEELMYRVTEGTVIETVLTNRLDGTFAGPVICLVTTAVYAPDHQHLLIPAGARALGEARPVTTFGQSRLAVTFH